MPENIPDFYKKKHCLKKTRTYKSENSLKKALKADINND